MKLIKTYLFVCLSLFVQTLVFSQAEVGTKTWALQLNVQHQDLSADIDFGQLGVVEKVTLRPFYTLDVEYAMQRKPNRKRIFTAQLGYYNNLYHEVWLTAKAGVGNEWQLFNKFYLGARAEFGATWVKPSDVRYRYDGERWVETENTALFDRGVFISPRLDFGYRIIEGNHPIDVAVNGTFSLAETGIGLAPYYAYGLGVRYGL